MSKWHELFPPGTPFRAQPPGGTPIVMPVSPGGFVAFSPAVYRYRILEPRGDLWAWGPEGQTNSLHWLQQHGIREGRIQIRRESGETLETPGPGLPWYWVKDGQRVGIAVNFCVCEAWNYPELRANMVAAEPGLAKWFDYQ